VTTEEARRGAVLFDMSGRGVIEVTGGDAERWLDGMVTNDVKALSSDPSSSGCYAALLTPQGRIVSDLQVLCRPGGFWLETGREAVPGVIERLSRYVVADDVALRDASAEHARFGIEGRGARAALEGVAGGVLSIGPSCIEDSVIAEVPVAVASFGWSGEESFQLFAPAAQGEEVSARLETVAQPGSASLLEALRVEAGIPALGSELAEDTLPDEARIGHAISESKGCYTGQEVIARLRSRGGVKHQLVGLRGRELPAPGARLERESGKRTGELTSRCESALAGGEIALGFVHRDDATPGTRLVCEGQEVLVAALPFVTLPAAESETPPA